MVQLSLKSSLPDVDIPALDIPTFFFNSVKKSAEFTRENSPRPLFVDGAKDSKQSITLAELEDQASKLASGLYHHAGLRSCDVVAVVMPNSIHYTTVILAVLMTGASCTLVNPAYTARELAHQLLDSKAKHVFTTAALCPNLDAAISENSIPISQLYVVDETAPTLEHIKAQPMSSIFCEKDYPRAYITNEQEQQSTVAFIPYSSGTTGKPKGVMLSHRNIIANILQAAALVGCQHQKLKFPSTSVGVLPMFHSFGLLFLCLLMPFNGTSTVIMSKFDMTRFLQIIQEYRVTETMLVPPILNCLAKMPKATEQYDLSSLITIIVGAAPLSSDTIAALEKKLPQMQVLQGYGMSEGSPALSLNPASGLRNVLSVGRLVPNIEARVLNDEGKFVGIGKSGELCFRGPNVMLGYVNNPEETQKTIDQDGFLHTGDVGYIDEHQHVFITDRKKELIKFNGFQVAPAELEGLLMQHPQVRDCAVAGVFDEARQTEVPKAFLVLADTDAQDAQTIGQKVVEWLNAQVAYFKQLRGGFTILDVIPKSASGKILRRMLK
ncbi:hypothetical protein IWW36_003163 [Coemansia brasiliensis]|uniref:Uncharacterized protein n=1 Tax=Coemansia brasiliensis TaxID=2650707 RepID=A0A9W8I8A6_9FUNG|nr:hypothetical protein IWW36_003163 [Coemansia brasiliensis]